MARTGRPREFDRQAALEAAMMLFWKQGFEPTSLNQLKDVMGGISPTSFYTAFGSKERLFAEVVEFYLATKGQVTGSLFDDEISPRQAIERCLRQSVRMQTDAAHPFGCLVVMGTANSGPDSDTVIRLLQEERGRNRDAIRRQVMRAVKLGELPKDTEISSLATMIDTFLVGISMAARDGVDARHLDAAVDHVMRCWSGK